MEIMSELREIGKLFSRSEFHEGLSKVQDLWMIIPEPKVDTPNAYLVIEYAVAFSLKVGDLEEAQKWAVLALDFAGKREDRGEAEFLIGKVAFVREEFEIARENFQIANIKSKGRIFDGEDPKYRKLLKSDSRK